MDAVSDRTYGTCDGRLVTFTPVPGGVTSDCATALVEVDGERGGRFSIDAEDGLWIWSELVIDDAAAGRGIATWIVDTLHSSAAAMGYVRARVETGYHDGGWFWARRGFLFDGGADLAGVLSNLGPALRDDRVPGEARRRFPEAVELLREIGALGELDDLVLDVGPDGARVLLGGQAIATAAEGDAGRRALDRVVAAGVTPRWISESRGGELALRGASWSGLLFLR